MGMTSDFMNYDTFKHILYLIVLKRNSVKYLINNSNAYLVSFLSLVFVALYQIYEFYFVTLKVIGLDIGLSFWSYFIIALFVYAFGYFIFTYSIHIVSIYSGKNVKYIKFLRVFNLTFIITIVYYILFYFVKEIILILLFTVWGLFVILIIIEEVYSVNFAFSLAVYLIGVLGIVIYFLLMYFLLIILRLLFY